MSGLAPGAGSPKREEEDDYRIGTTGGDLERLMRTYGEDVALGSSSSSSFASGHHQQQQQQRPPTPTPTISSSRRATHSAHLASTASFWICSDPCPHPRIPGPPCCPPHLSLDKDTLYLPTLQALEPKGSPFQLTFLALMPKQRCINCRIWSTMTIQPFRRSHGSPRGWRSRMSNSNNKKGSPGGRRRRCCRWTICMTFWNRWGI